MLERKMATKGLSVAVGFAEAVCDFGYVYSKGVVGVPQDHAEAVK